MAKKKSHKKHQFKYATPTTGAVVAAIRPEGAGAVPAQVRPDAANYAYVLTDIGRIGMLAGGFLLLELVLWYLMNHTSLGTSIYSLVKL